MRKTLLALTATAGLIGFSSLAASAAPLTRVDAPQASAIHQADWNCGPRCQYWHHRRWEESRRDWRWHHERPYYSYNNGYGYYYR